MSRPRALPRSSSRSRSRGHGIRGGAAPSGGSARDASMTAGSTARAQSRGERMSHRGPRERTRPLGEQSPTSSGASSLRVWPAGDGRNGSTQPGPAAIPVPRSRSRTTRRTGRGRRRSRCGSTGSTPWRLRRSPRRSRRGAEAGALGTAGVRLAATAAGVTLAATAPGVTAAAATAGVTLAAAAALVAAPEAVVAAAAAVELAATATAWQTRPPTSRTTWTTSPWPGSFARLGSDLLRLLRRPLSACGSASATAPGLELVVVDGEIGEQRVEPAPRGLGRRFIGT